MARLGQAPPLVEGALPMRSLALDTREMDEVPHYLLVHSIVLTSPCLERRAQLPAAPIGATRCECDGALLHLRLK